MKRVVGIAALLVLSLLPRAWAQQDSAAEAAKKPRGFPVLPGIYRLHGSAPNLPQDDLEPLRQIVGKATIVSLGESIHTSGGYYEMKHRIFRFLVEKMGFRVFAFESPWPDADRVGHYIQTCEGTPETALTGLFSVWQSTETRDLVQWMCDWNRTHRKKKDKLHFFGFDVQQPAQDGAALIAFLERIGVGSGDPRIADIRVCDGVSSRTVYPDPVPEASNQQCLRGLASVEQLFNEEAGRIVAETSPPDLEYARLRLVGLRSWQGQIYYQGTREFFRSTDSRDSGMAYAFRVLRQLRYGNLKTVVWAHNFHIAKDVPKSTWNTRTMGLYLREMFGPSYVSLALISNATEIDWPSQGCGPVQVFRSDRTVEKMLHDLGHAALLVDLEFGGDSGGAPPFLGTGENYRMSEVGMVPAEQFDGAFFLEHSRKMAPLRWPSCR